MGVSTSSSIKISETDSYYLITGETRRFCDSLVLIGKIVYFPVLLTGKTAC